MRYKYHLLGALILLFLLFMGAKTRTIRVTHAAMDLPPVSSNAQINQALEFFPQAKASLTEAAQGKRDMREVILAIVSSSLKSNQRDQAFEIARAIIVESNHHHMDPLFLLAVIATESRFNIAARGRHGEIGLMQVLPATAKWLAPQAGLNANYDLQTPAVNIRFGATYLSRLRRSFNHKSKRYVAAYNMGSKNVRRWIASNYEPQIYPTRVINNYQQMYLAIAPTGRYK